MHFGAKRSIWGAERSILGVKCKKNIFETYIPHVRKPIFFIEPKKFTKIITKICKINQKNIFFLKKSITFAVSFIK